MNTALMQKVFLVVFLVFVLMFSYEIFDTDEKLLPSTDEKPLVENPVKLTAHIQFPAGNVSIEEGNKVFPLSLVNTAGVANILIRNGGYSSRHEVKHGLRVDIPLVTGKNEIKVYQHIDGRENLIGSRTISMLPASEIKILLDAAPKIVHEPDGSLPWDFGVSPPGVDFFSAISPAFAGIPPEIFCPLDVDVHRPVSQNAAEPLVPELSDFSHGAYTLRNDDADFQIGRQVNPDVLPIPGVPTDLVQSPNALENDLVRVDAHNPLGMPNVFLIAFPKNAEANRNLTTAIIRANGTQANFRRPELGYYTNATKGALAALPMPVPQGMTSIWVEGKLGGDYRFMVVQLPPAMLPANVRYDTRNDKPQGNPGCHRLASLKVVVVDIFQGVPRFYKLTAFDVFWGGKPHFRAKVWPGRGNYHWAVPYVRGAAQRGVVPGVAVNGDVAYMVRDAEDPRAGSRLASVAGHAVTPTGRTGRSARGAKLDIEGGIEVNQPGGNRPNVPAQPANRYPDRISLSYSVDGEVLIRIEPLEIILPDVLVQAPNPNPAVGGNMGARSTVLYTIQDQYQRRIYADSYLRYLQYYGAGMRAIETLSPDANTQELRRTPQGRRQHPDLLQLTNLPGGVTLDFGTAQLGQARVIKNRMQDDGRGPAATGGVFEDTLNFTLPGFQLTRLGYWRHWLGLQNVGQFNRRQDQARQHHNNRNGLAQQISALQQKIRRTRNAARRARLQAQLIPLLARMAALDAPFLAAARNPVVFDIEQDVVLELRVGAARYRILVLEGNHLILRAPYFYPDWPFNGGGWPIASYTMAFTQGNRLNAPRLINPPHRRP